MQSLKLKLCEEYEKLGKLTYKSVKTSKETGTEQQIAKIDAIRLEMKQIKDKLEALKQKEEDEEIEISIEAQPAE